MRSPNYPAVGLREAVKLAQDVWNREKRSPAPLSAIVQAWGYAGLSGNARTKIAAMRKYGLLDETDSGDLRLSDRAIHILHNHQDSLERLSALREAALSPELFLELQQTYPEASSDTIRSYLITKKGFSDVGADAFIKAFRDTQEIAKLSGMEVTPITPLPQSGLPPAGITPPPAGKGQQPPPPLPPGDSETTFRWPLSRGVVAEVRFIGDAKPAHLDLLKQYLDVAKGAMEADGVDKKEEPTA